jgi:hypothetical protein
MTLALSDPLTSTDSEPQGESAGWDEKLIALLALLTAADLLLAESLWDTFAPRGYAGLLLAVAVDDAKETPVAEGFWFWRVQEEREKREAAEAERDAARLDKRKLEVKDRCATTSPKSTRPTPPPPSGSSPRSSST